jgi:hypothetical protein
VRPSKRFDKLAMTVMNSVQPSCAQAIRP